jgi:hypothetical protein
VLIAFAGNIDSWQNRNLELSTVVNPQAMQAYRRGRSQLVLFEDVDVAFMVERDCDGEPTPLFYIVRAAQDKTMQEIHEELQLAKTMPLGKDGIMSALELQFYRLPKVLRRLAWVFFLRNPYLFKAIAGTVALTSFGMHTSGAAVGVPISPMTLTLTVGAIETKPFLYEGRACERDVIHLTLSLDHDIVDGAPAMRFIARFKEVLRTGITELSTSQCLAAAAPVASPLE